jgi:hypothetical protein
MIPCSSCPLAVSSMFGRGDELGASRADLHRDLHVVGA